ncbi:MAG: hypothetical protein MAGBODY4_00774 [Candidatus Marinimicrobia bacterium]|nr:hypothetical protein [Candidatus Neomarinimicrobiota bacterium]
MRRILQRLVALILLLLPLLGTTTVISAQENSPGRKVEFDKVRKGDFHVGLFGPLRYGLANNMELQTHPIFDFVIPNAKLIWTHKTAGNQSIQTRHSLVYPTPLLRLISRKGTGGILPDDPTIVEIPSMISLYNEIRYYRIPFPSLEYYFSGGIGFAGVFGDLDERTTIDLPVVFPRLGVFYNGYSLRVGSGMDWKLSPQWGMKSDAELIWLPGYSEAFFWEHSGQVRWQFSESWNLMAGYLLTFGTYPFGKQYHLLPLFDLGYRW